MNTTTKTIVLPKSASDVFDFVSKPENLPKWAIHFCKSIRKEGDDFKVDSPMGEMFFDMDTDKDTGVLDMHTGPAKEQMMTCPTRIVDLPEGNSLFSMTCVQMPGMSDEEYKMQGESLDDELIALKNAVG